MFRTICMIKLHSTVNIAILIFSLVLQIQCFCMASARLSSELCELRAPPIDPATLSMVLEPRHAVKLIPHVQREGQENVSTGHHVRGEGPNGVQGGAARPEPELRV